MRQRLRWWPGLAYAGVVLLLSAGAAPAPSPISQVLRSHYLAWTPVVEDTTPLAQVRTLGLDWEEVKAQFSTVFDDDRAYAELRGVTALPDGQQSIGVLRAGIFRNMAADGVLVVNDEWCAAGTCKARTRFVLLTAGKPGAVVTEIKVVPLILDRDLLPGPVPECLRGVVLGVQYLPSRLDASMTALATVPSWVRTVCEGDGVELSLITRPLRLKWNAAARKFGRGW